MFSLCIEIFKNETSGAYSTNHSLETRNCHLLRPVFQRLAQTQRSVSYAGPTVWNSLPPDLKEITSLATFKRKLKQFFIDKY